jgi:two-component system chemotaxis response regulator CheV
MTKTSNKYEIYYDELMNLISSDVNISNQYVIFQTSASEYYGVNVAKVEELVPNRNLNMINTTNSDPLTKGLAKIRENITILLNFDDWIGIDITNEDELKLIILCKYAKSRLGLIVNKVIGIQRVDLNTLCEVQRDKKILYTVEITVDGQKQMCNIFDFDQLTLEIYPNIQKMNETLIDELQIDTNVLIDHYILIAEDSKLIQEQLKQMFNKMDLNYNIFNNGQALLEYAKTAVKPEEISLIITDIEMPTMDGIELIGNLKDDVNLENIPIVVHTNMAKEVISSSVKKYNVNKIIDKLDFKELKKSINKYCHEQS